MIITRTRFSLLIIVAVLLFSSLPLPVASADESPSIQLTITPQQTIYDIAGNESRQENVTFSVFGININGSNTYKIRVAVHEEYQTYGEDALLLLSTNFDLTISVNLNFSGIGAHEWVNDTNYTILVQLQERPAGQDQYETIFNATFNFSIGKIPEPLEPEPLQHLDFECELGDDGEWDMMLDDYGYLADHPSALGMIGCTFTNPNPVPTWFNFSFDYPILAAGAGFDITGITLLSNEILNNSTKQFNFSLDCGAPSNCEETNGTISIEVEIYSEDAVNWTGNDSSYFVEYSIENNSTITPILIRGCMDEEALNFKLNATEDDGSCVFPQPEPEPEPEPTPPDCLLCNLTYYIPSEMSVGTTDTFYVVENSGDGWKYFGEANVSWNIDGVVENGSEIEYSFTAIPELGHASVSICASFSDGSQDCIWEEITVNQSLNGYISQSGVLEPIIQDNVGGVHFNVTALGGLAPYSFEWQFGDGNSSTSSSLVYEFADWGIYDVTLVITDARMDTVNLQTQVEIKNSQDPGDDPTIVDKENVSEPEVTPFGAVATGGGTLLLVMLSRHNSRKQKEKILVAARAKLQNAGMGNEETLGVDDFEGNWD